MKDRSKSPLTDTGNVLNEKEDVTQLLILRFQQLLSEGLLTPGARLPPERELAASFGVARSSLRPALKVLEIMGVITQKVWRRQLSQQGCILGTVCPHGISLSPR
jgi:GntR family transcriptional repressor for pyruvate dehydrogenase complex